MSDESPLRSGRKRDAGDGASGGAGEPASLQGRAAFLAHWDWQSVVRLNERLCGSRRAQHGKNSETHAACEKEWREGVKIERTLLETLDWLRSFHRKAPFLFFNGNTFAELARTLTDAFFAEFPHSRRREAASLAAHFVAGVLDQKSVVSAIASLVGKADFQPGDRVKTLKGSVRGTILRVLKDGRVVWQADTGAELTGLPESLIHEKNK
jgi:hypothetical protein